jgi:YbgC/YbaW family acyl-CoA thioester hydrolase
MHVFHLAVRPSDLDSFGHVNNARYFEYLEWARADWLTAGGFTYKTFWDIGVIPAVIQVRLRFQHECKFGDRLRIESYAEIKHSARIEFHQEIFLADGTRALRGVVSVVAVDASTRTLTEFPKPLLDAVVSTFDARQDRQ